MICVDCDHSWEVDLTPAQPQSSALSRIADRMAFRCPKCNSLPDFLSEVARAPATWPDGLPVHDITLYVRLTCGHERVSRGWRGNEGELVCCDEGCGLVFIAEVSMTDEEPRPWSV